MFDREKRFPLSAKILKVRPKNSKTIILPVPIVRAIKQRKKGLLYLHSTPSTPHFQGNKDHFSLSLEVSETVSYSVICIVSAIAV